VDTHTQQAVRVAPRLDVRQRAIAFLPQEPRHYFAQLRAYQIMADNELLTIQAVHLVRPLGQLISRAGVRTSCMNCGEEIINQREVSRAGETLCIACAESAYYRACEPGRLSLAAIQPAMEMATDTL
jgi:formylmethanofuran dehydrogenase subunit E